MHPSRRSRWLISFAVSLALLLCAATAAQAQRKYALSGPARALAYLVPQIGTIPIFNPPDVAGTALQTGSSPATLVLRPGVFDQTGAVQVTVPVGTPPQYVQFASGFYIQHAPTASAQFSAGPKTSRPATFSFCPGATANPACTTGATAVGQGTRKGRVRYTPGPNQFGGTMTTLEGGGLTISIITQVTPTQRIRHSPLNVHVINGQGYGVTSAGTGPPAQVTTGGVINSGIITQPGNVVSTIPGFQRSSTAFPFTTGQVIVTVPQNPPTSPDISFTGTGYDTRTPLGAGNISMVAGALGGTNLAIGAYGTLETIYVSLSPLSATPALGGVGIALLGTAIVLTGSAFVARRRR